MMGETVFIGIGSNLEGPIQQLAMAIQELAQLPDTQLKLVSSLYRSRPMGPQDQPDYVNAVVSLQTQLEPEPLLDMLQGLESKHGRIRTGQRWGARTLDLDILLYGENVLKSERLIIPHPGLHERSFVLYPLSEICPDLCIPGLGTLSDLLMKCPDDDLIKITT